MQFKDLFSTQAIDYAKFRPTYPEELYRYLGSLSEAHNLVFDAGTGNGQAAVELAKVFKKVYATDPAQKQIDLAPKLPHIEYKVEKGEEPSLPDNSADLITVAQAFHWFDHQKFALACKRIGKKNSHLAVWSYALMYVSPEIDKLVMHLYSDVLGDYWEKERKLVEEGYKSVVMPFPELTPPAQSMYADWTLEHLVGYLSTWSALQTYIKKEGRNPLEDQFEKLKSAWGDQKLRRISWPLNIRVWKID